MLRKIDISFKLSPFLLFMFDIKVFGDIFLPASEEELDAIVQAVDGKDYVVALVGGKKTWCLFSDNVEQNVEFSICNIIPDKTELLVKKKGMRGRPRKPVDSDAIPRKPRQPTAYNLFMKEKLLELSQTHPSLKNKDRMKMASDLWKGGPTFPSPPPLTQRTQVSVGCAREPRNS